MMMYANFYEYFTYIAGAHLFYLKLSRNFSEHLLRQCDVSNLSKVLLTNLLHYV